MTSCLNSTISYIKSFYSQFSSAGGYLVQGFAAGIKSNTYKAEAQAKAMAKAAYEAACGVENPETGINTTIVVVITGTLLAIGCYAFFRKNKMYY